MRARFDNLKAASPQPLPRSEPDGASLYPIEEAARLSQVSRRWIAVYCRYGLISPVMDPARGGWFFDDEALWRLRYLERLRQLSGASMPVLRLLLQLQAQVEHLQQELRFWRGF